MVVAIHELSNPRGYAVFGSGRTLLCKDCDLYRSDKAEAAQWVRRNSGGVEVKWVHESGVRERNL